MLSASPFYAMPTPLVVATTAIITYPIWLAFHRLYFSPLADFPGPKLAAATRWYEFYFDWWLGGKYIFEIERLHKNYGPIIRVNPDELSISDPSFYNEVYVIEYKRRTEHYDAFAQGLDFDGSYFTQNDCTCLTVKRLIPAYQGS
jgi:hypothetical protein